MLLQRTTQIGQPLTCSYLISMGLGHLYALAVNFHMSQLSPMASYLHSLFVSSGIEATALLLLCRAASLTKQNALVALAHTTLELALLRHQAKLILLASRQSMLPLLVLVASLGTNGLHHPCSLSRVHPTLSLACFRLEDISLQV